MRPARRRCGVISDLLGDEPVRILQRDKRIHLGAGLTMHLVTKRIALRQRGQCSPCVHR